MCIRDRVIEDLQAQFHSFNESATKHIGQITENIKADKSREAELLRIDNESLKNEIERLNQGKEVTMIRKKPDEAAPERQTREHFSIKEQLKRNLEQKQQDVINMEKQMKTQSELYEKNKQELEATIKTLKEREASLQAKITALESLEHKENEIMAYKRKITELNDKILIMTETINKEDNKEVDHKEILKKLVDIAIRGKQIIEMKNQILEKLKRERQVEGVKAAKLSLIHICRCRRYAVCRSRWSPYH
eukprot:TRINITY_DN19213_c0_g1_i1.p1 TRINITY_DN19213_c0_g1~~TRINITY_DN19213_c0_g1_i1.p1  ORF type:complete len:249 (+),score=73.04 TRINITY_DN19213_c0_g1_i1:73-819(+)